MSRDNVRSWLATILPLLREGGPVLSLLLALLLGLLLWYGGGLLRECVERNRRLGDQLVTQQEKFHAEVLLHLRGCTKSP